MNNLLDAELTTDDPVEIKKLIDQYLEAMRLRHEQMAKDQEEIDQLKTETRAMLKILREAMENEDLDQLRSRLGLPPVPSDKKPDE